MKISVVTTTINVPYVLKEYIENASKYSHDGIEYIIVGDRKTPQTIRQYLSELNNPYTYLGIPEQEEFIRRFPKLNSFLPWNCVERRNLGYLVAAEHEADVIITIDDDNAPLDRHDFFGAHSIVGNEITCNEIESSSGWFNLGTTMITQPKGVFYVRGFPVSKRWVKNFDSIKKVKARIGVNAGLWIGDPDVDTLTRIANPSYVLSSNLKQLVLGHNTHSPFNSQNTSFHKTLLPCMYLITFKQGSSILSGNNSFRFDDIWMSYFCKKLMDKIGDKVCFGLPYVTQNRNPHNYLEDMKRELPALIMTDRLVNVLEDITISSTNYQDGYDELTDKLRGKSPKFPTDEAEWLQEMVEGMSIWSSITRAI